jgi:hypothetical protein
MYLLKIFKDKVYSLFADTSIVFMRQGLFGFDGLFIFKDGRKGYTMNDIQDIM